MAANNQGLHFPTFRSIFQKVPSVIIFLFMFFTFSATLLPTFRDLTRHAELKTTVILLTR